MSEDNGPLVKYQPAEAEITSLAEEVKTSLATLEPGTPERYRALEREIGKARTFRTTIEKRRVELKAESLAWGRKVDAKAKQLTGLVLEIEDPLRKEKEAVDAEKERVAREKVEAEKARLKKIEDDERAAKQAELDAQRKALEEDRARLAEERKAQEAVLEAARQSERRIFEEQRAKANAVQATIDAENARIAAEQKAERDKIDAERRAIEEEKRIQEAAKRREQERLERIEFEKAALAKAEADAAAKRKREIEEAEQRRLAEEAEHRRIEAAKPDVQKIQSVGRQLKVLVDDIPKMASQQGSDFVAQVITDIQGIAARCLSFKVGKGVSNERR